MEITPAGPAKLRLRPLRADDEQAVRAANAMVADNGFDVAAGLAPDVSWLSYLEWRAREHADIGVPPDRVPATFLIAEVDGVLVGRTSIRHRLNGWLLAHGGHIGYGVPPVPSAWPGHRDLRQSLVVARAHGVERALLTCAEDNTGSIRVIERCGGRRDERWPSTPGDVPTRRYWIDCGPSAVGRPQRGHPTQADSGGGQERLPAQPSGSGAQPAQ